MAQRVRSQRAAERAGDGIPDLRNSRSMLESFSCVSIPALGTAQAPLKVPR